MRLETSLGIRLVPISITVRPMSDPVEMTDSLRVPPRQLRSLCSLLRRPLRPTMGPNRQPSSFSGARNAFAARSSSGIRKATYGLRMIDQPKSERFKAEMPQIPGVVAGGTARRALAVNPTVRLVAGLVVVLAFCILGSRWLLRPKHTEAPPAAPPPQIEVPAPAVDPTASMPRATATSPEIATVAEMAKPWTAKSFFFVNALTGENVPALLIRLSSGSASQPNGYWALETNAPFGNCKLEYVSDLDRLINDYDFRSPKHPMVGNPCSRSVFDPLKMSEIPGDFWVRGSLAQGSDVRPPLGIELQIQGKNILALLME